MTGVKKLQVKFSKISPAKQIGVFNTCGYKLTLRSIGYFHTYFRDGGGSIGSEELGQVFYVLVRFPNLLAIESD